MILVIDRDKAICDSIKEFLEWEGYKVDCAKSIELAQPFLNKNFYSVILIERLLLKSDDFSFVGQGRVVVMTSCNKDTIKFTNSLQRPFTLASLLDSMDTI